MSRILRRQLFSIAELLEKANRILEKKLFTPGVDEQAIIELVTDCQDSAISMGEQIEKMYGEGTVSVGILEQYCETLYLLTVSMQDTIRKRELYNALNKQLKKLRGVMNSELPDKLEVVFFPYKASMWDSLESVYLAAKEDENCDAYCVPIPYYDKHPDGTFKEEHYEGDSLPDYVTITNYKEYNFKERRPDVTFIHNPYDACNYVTSVHPDFYARNLKQFTNKLVYIPYFTLGEEMYASFCVSPGTIISDVVIAQSYQAQKDYIYHLKKWYMDNTDMPEKVVEQLLSDKIMPLGSPKIDKIINADRNLYTLPEQWNKLLQGKKAVLYNTGVSGILGRNKQELDKIKDTIAFFQQREDVVLWWRPHPLTLGTLQSMRPELYQEYLEIVEMYKKSKTGIFDDTTDLYRAILCTDMYYGDNSSLIYLYGVQGKPIILQNIDYLMEENAKEKDYSINYRVACVVGKTLFLMAKNYNYLFQMDLESREVSEIGKVPGEYDMENSLYSNIIHKDDSLWLIPSRAHALVEYSLINKEWTRYEIAERIKYSKEINQKIYMISSDYSCLWIMDLEKRVLSREKLSYPFGIRIPKGEEYYNDDLYLIENKLYYLITRSNMIVQYDLTNKSIELLSLGADENKYLRLVYDGCYFWAIPDDGESSVVRWNGRKTVEIGVNAYPVGFNSQWGFQEALCMKDSIFLFPQRGNMILRLDKEKMTIENILEFNQCRDIENIQRLDSDKFIFVSSMSETNCCITIMDYSGKVLSNYPIVHSKDINIMSDKIFDRIDKEQYNCYWSYLIKETGEYSISTVCDALIKMKHINRAEKDYFRGLYVNGDGSSGRQIWQKVRNL